MYTLSLALVQKVGPVSREYTFALRGDSSFTLLTTRAELIQDKPSRIRFRTKTVPGLHVAMVELSDAPSGAVMQVVPLSIKVPDTPEILAAGIDKYTATMVPRRDDTRLIYLDSDVQAARYHLQIPYERDDDDAYGPDISCGRKKPDSPPVDATHHVGPLVTCDSLVANRSAGFQYISWENRAFHAEYETPYDPPAPTVPITGTVTVTKYAIALGKRADQRLTVKNKLADIDGHVELYDAALRRSQLTGAGSHSSAELERTLPEGLAEWRIRVTAHSSLSDQADVYLLDCSGKEGCKAAAQQEIAISAKTIAIDTPQAGDWKIVVRSRDQVQHAATYTVREALLTKGDIIDPQNAKHLSGESWTLPLPPRQGDGQYAGFRIRGTLGVESEKNGLLVAVTPLGKDAP
jgi:hypothetical protein